MLNDPLSNMMSNMLNATISGKSECQIRPISEIMAKILTIMQENHYIGKHEITEDNRGNAATIFLIGKINKCGAIKPRFSVKKNEYEKFEKRFLLAKDFGLLFISTPKGLMTHIEAKEKGFGGKLIAYVY